MKHIHKKPDDDRTGIIWRKPEAQHILTMAAFWDFLSKKYLRQISIFRYRHSMYTKGPSINYVVSAGGGGG